MAGKTFRMPPLPSKKLAAPTVDFESGGAGSDVFFQAKGLKSLEENLRSLPQIARDAAGQEMAVIAAEIIEDAKEHYVPVLYGNLRESGGSDTYEPYRGTMPTITQIGMWFGAPMTAEQKSVLGDKEVPPSVYAEVQHEDLFFKHSPPPDESGPKYLEKPFLKAEATFLPRLAAAITAAMGEASSGLAGIESGLRSMPNYPGYGSR